MPEYPEIRPDQFRSDHDPAIAGSATAPAKPKPTLWRRIRAWAIILSLYAVILGMAAGGILLLRPSFHSSIPWDERLVLALGLLAPLAWIIWFFLKKRWQTGRWSESPEQREQRRAQCRANGTCRPGRTRPQSWARSLLHWAGYTAFEPSCTAWQRIAGWTVLAGYALYLLALTAIGVICIGASFADSNTLHACLLFIGLGLLLFLIPGMAVRAFIRRISAGQVRVSREEMEQVRTQRAAWRVRESQKPLRSKMFTVLFIVAAYGWWWLRVTLFHAQHPHESWVTPAIYTPFALYLIWSQFRRPKASSPAAEPDTQPAPSPQA